MATVAFDTLKFSKRLKEAGVPEKKAEAEAEALVEIMEVNLKNLATKDDLVRMEERFDTKLTRMEERFDTKLTRMEECFDARLTQVEQRMVIKLGGLMVVAVGAVAALVKLL